MPKFFSYNFRRYRSATSFKTILQRSFFLVIFEKFLGAPFVQNTTRRLFLIIAVSVLVREELANKTVNYDICKLIYVLQFVHAISSLLEVFYKKVVLKNFSKLPGKHKKHSFGSFLFCVLLVFLKCSQNSQKNTVPKDPSP